MKRIFSLILVICMLVSALPYTGSAITYDQLDTVFTGFTKLGFEMSSTAKLTMTEEKIQAYPYYHFTAEAGDYKNTDLIISVKAKNILPEDYPIVKVGYRTNSPAPKLDVSIYSTKGENWMSNHPNITADGNWNTLTFNYNDITAAGTQYFPEAGDKNVTFRFKPFGSQSYTLSEKSYFDLHYVGFFKTEAEAAAFEGFKLESDGYPYPIATPEALFSNFAGSSAVASTTFWRIDDTSSYVRFIAEPGTYNNNLMVTFSHDQFPLVTRPYIKLAYRTDSKASKLDISMISDKGENWSSAAKKPALVGTGEITELVFAIGDLNAASGIEAPDENSGVVIRLKPWGAQTVTITESSYFDLFYVGFFESAEEANAFSYPGDNEYGYDFVGSEGEFNYSFAPKATVRDYIDAADARIDEVLHTTNTVPYMQHLTLTGLTGAYGASDKKDSQTYYNLTIPKGKHTAGSLKFAFTQNDVAFSSYPFIKLSYKSEVSSAAVATLKSSTGSASVSFQLTTSTNEYTQKLFDLSDFENYQSILAGSSVSFEVLPLGNTTKTLISPRNIAIEYIGLFKTR
ncbi:MAG: hypothetical protein IJD67_00710, partial [Clostridia bacterium]|nr:hypothetical protein [Clostridia bacterium]